ncbi:predicted protein [Naegleria gruberi]|uniref:D-serine dehydratase n=1 Tax=Naegleria gruberi TaxID=5762 RepID=D2V9D3_NAEGR|nr:uncharacterized protein NAEGRDRAFT_32191 [Naegleria gruberi]EFC46440.1 predicted protein [Naegleria gruberi]|eukprot:XP_002679184.1 predicted protein [Naegleria gruberi strain NEG-M]
MLNTKFRIKFSTIKQSIITSNNNVLLNYILHSNNNNNQIRCNHHRSVQSPPWTKQFSKEWIVDMKTPCFVVDLERFERNCQNMIKKASDCGISLRPHVKTHKTLEGARLQTKDMLERKIVVSTLAEAEFYGSDMFNDIHYAVPISSKSKLEQVAKLTQNLKAFHIEVDNEDSLDLIEDYAKLNKVKFSLFVQVDSGQHRIGVDPNSEASVELVKRIHNSPYLSFAGLYTHAGHSYGCQGVEEIKVVARDEAKIISDFARKLISVGIKPKTVAVGSTPTCSIGSRDEWKTSDSLVNELHPGNYVFFDYMQTKIGSCSVDDCSAYLVSSVISTRPSKNQLAIDCGALSLSKDVGVSSSGNASYGLIMEDESLQLTGLTQEIGIVTGDKPIDFNKFKVGTKITIIPNHSCLAAALFDKYYVVDNSTDLNLVAIWKNVRGW